MTHSKTNSTEKKTARAVQRALSLVATPERAKINAWYFKTGKGEYGEGDKFIGVTMPDMRKVAKQFCALPLSETEKLLASPVNEYRQTVLVILVAQYKRADTKTQRRIVQFYLAHLDRINNWNLVDCSAPQILGVHYLAHAGEKKLYTLARSKDLWRRRVGIVATWTFIRAGKLQPTLDIAKLLLNDKHDLIHKATGWMLREVGKKDKKALEGFLKKHVAEMPRTMLRYAIERYPKSKRQKWMKK